MEETTMVAFMAMTLGEIIDSVKDNGRPDYDDLRFAVLALEALHSFDFRNILELADSDSPKLRIQAEESFRRSKTAHVAVPKNWVGWNNDPANPEYQKRRKISLAILEKAGLAKQGGA